MPKSLAELDLKDEELPQIALDDLPEFTGIPTPPQPGAYRFKLPDMSKVYETYETAKGTRLKVVFDRDHALQIVSSPGGKTNGETFQTQLNGLERERGKDKAVIASDLDYLLKAMGVKTRPGGMKAYAELLMTFSGREFGADLSYSWNCNQNRKIRVVVEGRNVEGEVEGCGKKYYQADKTQRPEQQIGRLQNGEYPVEVVCSGTQERTCGNVIRAFANLDNLRP